MKKNIITLLIIVLHCSISTAATTYNSSGCTASAVSSAIALCSDGDTVNINGGSDCSATWSTGITLTKSITIQGAGVGHTILTSSRSSGTALFTITKSSDTKLTRVTGIDFQLGAFKSGRQAILINGATTTSFIPTKIRVDNCSITGGGNNPGGIVTYGRVYGVIDNVVFTDVYSGVYGWGMTYDNQAWIDAYNAGGIFAGTSNAMFVEDCDFLYTSTINGQNVDAAIYLQQGGSSFVSRYNTFNASGLTPNFITMTYNNHGNQDYCSNYPGTCFRGMPIFESYNNTIICSSSNCQGFGYRGGSVIMHDETITGTASQGLIYVSEEECFQTAFFSPLRSSYPAQDQIFNSFFWNITRNGIPITDININSSNGSCTANFVQKDRDYFINAPQSSGGKNIFTGTAYGRSTSYPTSGDSGSMTFSSSGANAYYPYTPYTYHHPLRSETPAAPTNVRIMFID